MCLATEHINQIDFCFYFLKPFIFAKLYVNSTTRRAVRNVNFFIQSWTLCKWTKVQKLDNLYSPCCGPPYIVLRISPNARIILELFRFFNISVTTYYKYTYLILLTEMFKFK